MNDLVDPADPNIDVTVDLGAGQLVSMKAVQQIYSEITGRSETLHRIYGANHAVCFDDLRQLNAKVTQLYEQYNIVCRTCTVTLYHLDDQKQTFSSFERFELFDRTTLSPVENVRIEYNFLIVLPQMKKPQSYEVEVNIHSRAALIKKARTESKVRSDWFFEVLGSNTANVQITFVDYTVARNFQVAVDSWFKALPEVSRPTVLFHLKKLTGHLVFLFRFLSVLAFLLACYVHFVPTLTASTSSAHGLFVAAIVTFGGTFLLSLFAGKVGGIAADALRRLQCKSYLNLTRGDEIAAAELQGANWLAWLKATASLAFAIGANVLSSWLAMRIGVGQ